MKKLDKNYWDNKYVNNETGWDIGYVSTPIKEYINQLQNKDVDILIPGAGNGYEVEYLVNNGFKNVILIGDEFYKLRSTNDFLSFSNLKEAENYLIKQPVENAQILVKGSRGVQLEKLLNHL